MIMVQHLTGSRITRVGLGFLLATVMPLASCSKDDCPLCPPPNNPTPSGWFVQATHTQEGLNNVFAVDDRTVVASGGAGAIIRTANGGATWSIVPSGTAELLRGMCFTGAGTGWLVGDNATVLRTDDWGASWTPWSVPTTTHLRDVFFVDDNTGWIAGGPTGGQTVDAIIMKTVDGGDSWDVQPTSFTIRTMYFVDADSGCVAGGADLRRTTDGGLSWIPYDPQPPSWFGCLFFVDKLNGWASGGLGFIATTKDGGKSWETLTSGTTRNIVELYFTDADNGWYVARNPGTLAATTDGGATWRFQTNPVDVNPSDVCFLDDQLGWICGLDGLILKTVTGGW